MNEEEMFAVDIAYHAWKIIKYTEINLVKMSNHAQTSPTAITEANLVHKCNEIHYASDPKRGYNNFFF